MVDALERRAAANDRSAEAEHREILRASLLGAEEDFAVRAEALRRRLRSSVDSSETIRADRDRDMQEGRAKSDRPRSYPTAEETPLTPALSPAGERGILSPARPCLLPSRSREGPGEGCDPRGPVLAPGSPVR